MINSSGYNLKTTENYQNKSFSVSHNSFANIDRLRKLNEKLNEIQENLSREKVVSPITSTVHEDIDINFNKVSDKAFKLRECNSDKISEINEQISEIQHSIVTSKVTFERNLEIKLNFIKKLEEIIEEKLEEEKEEMKELAMKLMIKIDQKQKFLLDEVKSETKSRVDSFKGINIQVDEAISRFINNLKQYRDDCDYNDEIIRKVFKEESYKLNEKIYIEKKARDESLKSFKEMIKTVTQKIKEEIENLKISRMISEENMKNLLDEVRIKLNDLKNS